VISARYIDENYLAPVSNMLNSPLDLSDDKTTISKMVSLENPDHLGVLLNDESDFSVYVVMYDLNDMPGFAISTSFPRSSVRLMKSSIPILVGALILMFVIVFVSVLKFTDNHVLSPLKAIISGVDVIRRDGRYNQISSDGAYIFRQLAMSINDMAESLVQRAIADLSTVFTQRDKNSKLTKVSQDIRKHLNILMGRVELLGKTGLNDQQNNYLSSIETESAGLYDLLNNIVDFSMTDKSALSITYSDFDLDELLSDIIVKRVSNAVESSVELLYEFSPKFPRVYHLDAEKITLMMNRLLDNAFIRAHGCAVKLAVGMDKNIVKISVADNGVILNEEERLSILSRKSGEISLVKDLCERMSGTLRLDAVNNNNIFTIRIPVETVKSKPFPNINKLAVILALSRYENILKRKLMDFGLTISLYREPADILKTLETGDIIFDFIFIEVDDSLKIVDLVERFSYISKPPKPVLLYGVSPPKILTDRGYKMYSKFSGNAIFHKILLHL
jgi:signal transduction histidine kinase